MLCNTEYKVKYRLYSSILLDRVYVHSTVGVCQTVYRQKKLSYTDNIEIRYCVYWQNTVYGQYIVYRQGIVYSHNRIHGQYTIYKHNT